MQCLLKGHIFYCFRFQRPNYLLSLTKQLGTPSSLEKKSNMINPRMETLLNEQFHREMAAAMQYLAISSYFEDQDLDGFAHFFRLQAQEEMAHAMKQFDYVHTVDGKITMQAIAQPEVDFESHSAAVDFALKNEQQVTADINSLMKATVELNDFGTQAFLQFFVTEQIEEEEVVRTILNKLRMIGDNTSALYLLNEELKKRLPEGPADGTSL